jgi:hypothetical protein
MKHQPHASPGFGAAHERGDESDYRHQGQQVDSGVHLLILLAAALRSCGARTLSDVPRMVDRVVGHVARQRVDREQ